MTKGPQVEREYRDLIRDYENALAKYREVKAKKMEADLSETLEKRARLHCVTTAIARKTKKTEQSKQFRDTGNDGPLVTHLC